MPSFGSHLPQETIRWWILSKASYYARSTSFTGFASVNEVTSSKRGSEIRADVHSTWQKIQCWLMFSFSSTRIHKSFFTGLLSIPSFPAWCLPRTRCRILHTVVLYFMPFKHLWMVSCPSGIPWCQFPNTKSISYINLPFKSRCRCRNVHTWKMLKYIVYFTFLPLF